MGGEKGEGLEKVYKSITFLCIVLTLIFLFLTAFYSAKNDQGNACNAHTYMNTSGKELQNSVYFLTDNQESIIQPYSITTKNNINYEFCFAIASNITDAFRVSIVNENNTVLAKEFVHNETTKYCTPIETRKLAEQGYIGIKCDTCKSNEKICIKQEILGATTKIVKNNGSVEINYDNTLFYELHAQQNCDGLITFFMRWYITLIAFISIGVLVFFGGYEKIRDGFF